MSGEPAHAFDDGVEYERFMGQWSRAVARRFSNGSTRRQTRAGST
jgi:hypothetical protein